MKGVATENFRILFLSILISFSGCTDHKFYDLGDGFKYGYFKNKGLLNVYYNDQGIVDGICYSAEWNSSYILTKYYSYDSSGRIDYTKRAVLIDKQMYIKNPWQLESKGILSSNEDSIYKLVQAHNITFSNKKEITTQ